MIDQNESALLAKLPVEVRCRIYELVFGDKIIVFKGNSEPKFGHCLCPVRGQKWHWLSWDKPPAISCRCICHENDGRTLRVPLLLACRQIFSESVHILWSQNPIHVQLVTGPLDFGLFSDLRSTIPSANFHAIRSLEISVLHPLVRRRPQTLDDEWFSGWRSTWDVIKGMNGLVNIQAWIKMDQELREDYMTAEQEALLFAPLMGLNWLRDFKVEVTWPANEGSESFLRGAPFDLARNNDPIPGKPVWVEVHEYPGRLRARAVA